MTSFDLFGGVKSRTYDQNQKEMESLSEEEIQVSKKQVSKNITQLYLEAID